MMYVVISLLADDESIWHTLCSPGVGGLNSDIFLQFATDDNLTPTCYHLSSGTTGNNECQEECMPNYVQQFQDDLSGSLIL